VLQLLAALRRLVEYVSPMKTFEELAQDINVSLTQAGPAGGWHMRRDRASVALVRIVAGTSRACRCFGLPCIWWRGMVRAARAAAALHGHRLVAHLGSLHCAPASVAEAKIIHPLCSTSVLVVSRHLDRERLTPETWTAFNVRFPKHTLSNIMVGLTRSAAAWVPRHVDQAEDWGGVILSHRTTSPGPRPCKTT
jgi:hypothetical protein